MTTRKKKRKKNPAKGGLRLAYFPVNSAWGFIFGSDPATARPTSMGDYGLLFGTRAEAVEAARHHGLAVAKNGGVSVIDSEKKNPKRRKRRVPARKVAPRPKHRRARRKNPALTTRGFVIQLKSKHGLWLEFDGERFSDNRQPKYFKTQAEALALARKILDRNPKINRLGYQMSVQLESSRIGRRVNPSIRDGLAQAERKLEDFSGHKATEVLRVNDRNQKTGLVIGSLDGVLYTTTRDGKVEKYIHRFRRKSRPLLAASSDGKSLKIVGGRFEFTEAGIEDR
jgi:hypothetical protein